MPVLTAPIAFDTLMNDPDFAEAAEAFEGYASYTFLSSVEHVARDMFTAPDVFLETSSDDDGYESGRLESSVTVNGDFGYLYVYLEPKALVEDRDAAGIAGYRAIYDALYGAFDRLNAMVTALVTSGVGTI